jgi:predicted amidohydrolase
MSPRTLTVALGEYDTGWHSPETSLAAATRIATHAAAFGARLVVLPEMTTTGFTR